VAWPYIRITVKDLASSAKYADELDLTSLVYLLEWRRTIFKSINNAAFSSKALLSWYIKEREDTAAQATYLASAVCTT
jgi:hypothetical protein